MVMAFIRMTSLAQEVIRIIIVTEIKNQKFGHLFPLVRTVVRIGCGH